MSSYDWSTTSDPMALKPGTYRVEIVKSEEKVSSNNNPMWVLTLRALDFNCKLCEDNLMLPPNGGANISKGKLIAMGFAKEKLNTVEPGHLLGIRTWVTVKEEPYKDRNGNDRTALRVNIDAKDSGCGYYKEKPASLVTPTAAPAAAADDTPF